MKEEPMSKNEHVLTIVEPTIGGDTTLDIARDIVARGGTTSVLMVVGQVDFTEQA